MREAKINTAIRQAFPPDRLTHLAKLTGHTLIGRDDVVKGIGDLAREAVPIITHTDAEIATSDSLQGLEHFDEHGVWAAHEAPGFCRPDLLRHEVHPSELRLNVRKRRPPAKGSAAARRSMRNFDVAKIAATRSRRRPLAALPTILREK
jgi:hypothetical protein